MHLGSNELAMSKPAANWRNAKKWSQLHDVQGPQDTSTHLLLFICSAKLQGCQAEVRYKSCVMVVRPMIILRCAVQAGTSLDRKARPSTAIAFLLSTYLLGAETSAYEPSGRIYICFQEYSSLS